MIEAKGLKLSCRYSVEDLLLGHQMMGWLDGWSGGHDHQWRPHFSQTTNSIRGKCF